MERGLGAVEGELRGLHQSFLDEREQARQERQRQLSKLERLEDEVAELRASIGPLGKQAISNKVELDQMKVTLGVVQTIYSRAMGVIGLTSTIIGMTFAGLWWALSHWGAVFEALKNMIGGR